MKLRTIANFGPAGIVIILLISLWEFFVQTFHMNTDILPPPSLIAGAMIHNWNIIAVHTMQTLLETIIGIFAAIILGVILAISLDSSPVIRRALYPLLISSQTI